MLRIIYLVIALLPFLGLEIARSQTTVGGSEAPNPPSFHSAHGFYFPLVVRGVESATYAAPVDDKPLVSMGKTIIAVDSGWNMLSIPRTSEDPRLLVHFPEAEPYAWKWWMGFIPTDTLAAGPGYWVKLRREAIDTLVGYDLPSLTIPVTKGWNLIGSISLSAPTSALYGVGNSITSMVFGYDHGYYVAYSIVPGWGYWVKTNGPGALRLSTIDVFNVPDFSCILDRLKLSSSITIRDAKGYEQQLYFTDRLDSPDEIEKYVLPPIPPKGSFDIRFANDRFVEGYDLTGKTVTDLEIHIRGARFPLSVMLSLAESCNDEVVLCDKHRNPLAQITSSDTKFSVVVEDTSTETLVLQISHSRTVPLTYELYQNYPNPFNPSTTIAFDMPFDGNVNLTVFDVLGRMVATPIDNQFYPKGSHRHTLTGSNWASGVYFFRIAIRDANTGHVDFLDVGKMMLMR